ncbi:hypothetical protein JHK86_009956 [Glycine max]|nr:hypothetical protein JHK86_009956 [Glycine max]
MEISLGYNSTNGQIIATDDEWKKLCEQFKKKSCLHYDELSIIFGDTAAFGANQHPSTKSPSTNDDDDGVEHSSQPKKKALVSVDTKKKNQEKTFKWHLLRL